MRRDLKTNKINKIICNEVPIIFFFIGFYFVAILVDKDPKYKKPNEKN